MKPVFGNYFFVMANPNGECVLNVQHTYPVVENVEQPADGKAPEVNSEIVASIVMTHTDAVILSEILAKAVGSVEPQAKPDTPPVISFKGGALS